MAKRKDIDKVLIIGSGPIIIGQACEFDYSGTQACKALRSLGYKIVLVNSNPATIMTDPGMADVTYIEPLNEFALTEIIKKERPDALLPNLGGQTGLNLSSLLAKKGVLDKYGVKVIGVNIDAIERGEDRTAFKETMNRLGIEMPRSTAVNSVEDAEKVASELGYPVVLRPAYTMGGTGGGLVYNVEELRTVCSRGLSASIVNQVLVEESVLGWEELELEVVRDARNQMITVCFIITGYWGRLHESSSSLLLKRATCSGFKPWRCMVCNIPWINMLTGRHCPSFIRRLCVMVSCVCSMTRALMPACVKAP